MTSRFTLLLLVTFVSACGAGARSPTAPTKPSEPELAGSAAQTTAERNPYDDYVVGPFETTKAGVHTYYIVRN